VTVTALRQRISLRRSETVALCGLAILLAVATVYDTTRQVLIDRRLHADLVSWHALTGSPDAAAFAETDTRHGTSTDVVCGRVPPAYPKLRFFACLVFQGAVRDDRRAVTGGYHLVASYRNHRWHIRDRPRYRYGCFGTATRVGFRCTGQAPAGAPHTRYATA
jgi:hypothetical protein